MLIYESNRVNRERYVRITSDLGNYVKIEGGDALLNEVMVKDGENVNVIETDMKIVVEETPTNPDEESPA